MKKIQSSILTLLLAGAMLQGLAQQKNILFIAVDDLKPLIGAYGDPLAQTPNIDRLADEGMAFTNAHCQQAVCGPSRASLLTGMYPDITEVHDLKTLIRDRNPDILTLPQHFKNNGYTTIGMGKIFDPRSVDKGYDKVSWSLPYLMPDVDHEEFGVPAVGTYQSPENKTEFEKVRNEGIEKGLSGGKLNAYMRENYKPPVESFDISDDGYFDGQVALEAKKQLNILKEEGNPFFLAVGFKKPHLPFVAPSKYWDLYDREKMPLAKYQQHARNTVQLPYHNSGELRSYTGMEESFGQDNILELSTQKELIHGYYACVSYVDALIGSMMDELEELGLKENTIVVLWGDHGWHLGDHGLWCKHTNFEQATRSPLIILDPGARKSGLNDSPAGLIDIFPTLCELTGVETPEHLQGTSLAPVLDGKQKSVNDFTISQYDRGKIRGYALRNDRYRFVAWYQDGYKPGATIVFKELYDYKSDPLEKENIVASRSDIAGDLEEQLDGFLSQNLKERKEFKRVNKPQRSVASNSRLIRNNDFEEGDKGWNTFGSMQIEILDEEAYSGQNAVKLTGTKGGISQKITGLKPNTDYVVSIYVKSENNDPVVLKVTDHGNEEVKARYTDAGYGKLSLRFTTGKSTEAKVTIQKYGSGSGNSWFDLVELIEVKAPDTGKTIKGVLESSYNNNVYIGATINYVQLGTVAEDILTSQFNYTVPENAAKQSRVHPEPGKWDWTEIDATLKMAEKNGLVVRLHGPISPQASPWAKEDNRTAKELELNMTEYMTEQCKRFNGHPAVKWMDVVNETVDLDGSWFSVKPGTDKWENPWTTIGYGTDRNKTPLYISKAFEIAQKYAPDVKLVYNQHGGMEPEMWEKVKETIVYLRDRGLRVDGIGWQAHLRSSVNLAFDKTQLDFLSGLIDWAHVNDLEFHVTEIDYKIEDEVTEAAMNRQADAYTNILKVLLSKRNSGVVTYNTWGITDGRGRHADKFMFMFNEDGTAKPAFYEVLRTVENPGLKLKIENSVSLLTEDFESLNNEKWSFFGQEKPSLSTERAKNGNSSIAFTANKSGIKTTLEGVEAGEEYTLEVWVSSESDDNFAIKVVIEGMEDQVIRTKRTQGFRKLSLNFTGGSNPAELIINRWNQEDGKGTVFVDELKITKTSLN